MPDNTTDDTFADDLGATVEDVVDPLDGLAERTKDNPGAPFEPDVLDALAEMRANNRAAFETLRAQLKKAGCRVTALDEAMSGGDDGDGRGPTQADILIDLSRAADLFHTSDGTSFADVTIGEHRETWPVRTKGFRRWLARQFFEQTGGAPNSEALQSALNVIDALCNFDGPERDVFIRVAELDGRIYLDLADDRWRAVEIDATGWRVVDTPPVRFRRAPGMLPLPEPAPGGDIDALSNLINLKSDEDFILVVAWLLAALRPSGPFPILAVMGEQGTAKTTTEETLRSLVDPNVAPLRTLPREDRELFIAASNGWIIAFDNLSGLPGWLSDTLCRLATGGAFAVRQLYTDGDEVLFKATRPMMLNGIDDFVSRGDLVSRCIFLTLGPIPEDRRKPKRDLDEALVASRPAILGALLDGVAKGLSRLPEVDVPGLPRMADFAAWATACEAAFWPDGTFMAAYAGNIGAAVDDLIAMSPVATAILVLVAERGEWTGTATELLDALAGLAGIKVSSSKAWPATPKILANHLKRVAPHLRARGINITDRRTNSARLITIASAAAEKGGNSASPSSPPPRNGEYSNGNNGLGGDARGDASVTQDDFCVTGCVTGDASVTQDDPCVTGCVTPNPLKTKAGDAGDAGDAKMQAESAAARTHTRRGGTRI